MAYPSKSQLPPGTIIKDVPGLELSLAGMRLSTIAETCFWNFARKAILDRWLACLSYNQEQPVALLDQLLGANGMPNTYILYAHVETIC